jgi:hypothetical protein
LALLELGDELLSVSGVIASAFYPMLLTVRIPVSSAYIIGP